MPEDPGAPVQVQPGAHASATAKVKQPVRQEQPEDLEQLQTPDQPPQPIPTLVPAAQIAVGPERLA